MLTSSNPEKLRYLDWCLQYARRQVDQDFAEVRKFPSQVVDQFIRFNESLSPAERWLLVEGMIYRGFSPDRFQADHRALWRRFDEFCLKEDSRATPKLFGRSRARGSRLLKTLESSWDTNQFGEITQHRSGEIWAELTDNGWTLKTWFVFDRSLLKYYFLNDPEGRRIVDRSSTLHWIGLSASEWDGAPRGSEDEVTELATQLLTKYSKNFLYHFSRYSESDSNDSNPG